MASETSVPVVFEAFVLCDDIRFENNGKLLLIGVYSDVVEVFKLPLQLRSLGLAVRAKAMAPGPIAFNVTATDPQGNNLLEANGEMNYQGEPGRTIWLPIVMGPALLTTEGVYRVRIALGDAPPVHETFVVKKTTAPEAAASPLPPN
jgi:hypothetical protein